MVSFLNSRKVEPMPTFTQLEYALAIDRERHFGKAASACHVSQPSLSTLILKLESELGYSLFDRSKKPILPTEDGEAFLKEAREIMKRVESLGALRNEEGPKGTYRLGIIPTMAPSLIPRIVLHVSKHLPLVQFQILEMKTTDIVRSLGRDEIDGGILATPLNEPGIFENPLFYEPFLLFASSDSPLKNKTILKEEDLKGNQIWLVGEGHCFRGQVLQICSQQADHVYSNIQLESSGMATVLELVKATKGATLIPYLTTLGMPDEGLSTFAKPWPAREVSLVTSRPRYKAKIHESIMAAITESIPEGLKSLKAKDVHVIGLSRT
jgi:LysR family hydrogen peroxide-inducible transcriptional activator